MQPTALNMSGLFRSNTAQQIQERLHSMNLSVLVCAVCVIECVLVDVCACSEPDLLPYIHCPLQDEATRGPSSLSESRHF